MTVRAILAGAVLLLAGACAMGPDYQPPTPPAGAQAPLSASSEAVDKGATPVEAWWRLYDDPRLDGLVAEAVAANRDLAVAQANLAQARAALLGSRASLFPQSVTRFSGTYGRDPITDKILEMGGKPPVNTWIFSDALDMSYELDLFGHVRRSVEASSADLATAGAERDAVKITVIAETSRAYALVCTLGWQLDVARRSRDLAANQAHIVADRLAAGAAAAVDVERAQGFLAQVEAEIPPLEGRRRSAFYQLSVLLGRTPAEGPAEVLTCATPPHLRGDGLAVGDGVALLRRRPDIRAAEYRVAGATARVGVATADLYPRISLAGFFGGASADFGTLTRGRAVTWGAGPSISWDFPIQAGPRARLAGAQAGETAAVAAFDSVVLQALRETESAIATYDADLTRRRALDQAAARDRRAFELASGAYRAGGLSYLDLLTAERDAIAADAALAATDTALSQDQIALFKALGGGWAEEGAQTAP